MAKRTERRERRFGNFQLPAAHGLSMIGISLSIAILAWIIFRIDFLRLHQFIAEINLYWVGIMVIIYLSGFVIRGVRWHLMLSPLKQVGVRVATEGVVVGYMANNLLPARAGELIRAIFVGITESMSKASVFGAVLVERVFDGLALVSILVVCSLFLDRGNDTHTVINSMIVFGCLIFGVAVGIVVIGTRRRTWIETKTARLSRYIPGEVSRKFRRIICNLLDSLSFLKTKTNFLIISSLSIIVWSVEGLVFWIGFFAFGTSANLVMAYFILAFVNLSMLVPSAPGGLGVFQGGAVLAFSVLGLAPEIALSYSIVVHLVMILPITLIGLLIINHHGISIRRLKAYNVALE